MNVLELLPLRVSKGLHGGCRRSENDRGAKPLRSHDRGIASVIARGLFLFVGGFVLLIDNDELQIRSGAKTAERVPTTTGARP